MKFTREQLEAQANQIEIGMDNAAEAVEDTYFKLGDELRHLNGLEILDIKKVNSQFNALFIQTKAYNEYVKLYKSIIKKLNKTK